MRVPRRARGGDWRHAVQRCGVTLALVTVLFAAAPVATAGQQPAGQPPAGQQPAAWPSFRGPASAGVAEGADPPETFSAVDGTNLAWRTEIPGLAHASPIVWGDRVYLTTAVGDTAPQRYFAEQPDTGESITDEATHRWLVLALDRHTGAILWERTAAEGVPRTGRLRKGTFNNSTPATDGIHVVALFGSQGLFCYDAEGNLLWRVDLGMLDAGWFFDPTVQWGTASSPVIHDGKVIVQADVLGGAFIAAFDIADGRELWRTPRDEVSSWGTPTVVSTPQRDEIVTNGGRAIRAYDPATGALLWSLSPSSEIAVPTPIFGGGLIFVGSGYLPGKPLYAVRPGGDGDISPVEGRRSSSQVAWSAPDAGPLIATPIVLGDYLYVLSRNGTLACYDAGTGLQMYREKIVAEEEEIVADAGTPTSAQGQGGGVGRPVPVQGAADVERPRQEAAPPQQEAAPRQQEAAPPHQEAVPPGPTFSASPVAVEGRLYIASEAGDVYVIEAGPFLRVIAVNPVGEPVLATPAIAGHMLLLRGLTHLYAFTR